MNTLDATPPSAHAGAEHFGFRTSNASIQGGIGAGILIAGWLVWSAFTGRIHEPDGLYWGGWGLSAMVMTVVLRRGHRASIERAHALGSVQLDAEGLHWVRADGTLALEFPWFRVADAIVEQRNATVVVILHAEEPHAPQTAVVIGDPSGHARFERFDHFLRGVGRYCALKDSATHQEDVRRQNAKKSWLASAVFAATSAWVLEFNGMLEATFSLRHVFPLLPCLLAFMAFGFALAGLGLWQGRAPLVSQLNHPKYWTRRVPLLLVFLVLSNFLLVWLLSL